jgi:AraC-like DNA-binding protein
VTTAYFPSGPLSRLVDFLWLHEQDDHAPVEERTLPTGSMQLIVSLTDAGVGHFAADGALRTPPALITGVSSTYGTISPASMGVLMGAAFRPHGAATFLDLPASELHGVAPALNELWGCAATELRERLLYAEDDQRRFQILEQVLLERLAAAATPRDPAVAYAVRRLEDADEISGVREIAESAGVSMGRLARAFSDEVGLTPKLFGRVRRFQRALGLLFGSDEPALAQVAADSGYYDQAHFCHDFRAFAGITPGQYLDARTASQNHVKVAAG